MSSAVRPHGPATDDWESHWSEYADSAVGQPRAGVPAAAHPRASSSRAGARSGSSTSAAARATCSPRCATHWPDAELAGIELTAEGDHGARSAKVPDARFVQLDLTDRRERSRRSCASWADLAVCSEVLEHVDDPARFCSASAMQYVAPGGTVVVTVPGGPRTAFDRHIGHRRHYTTRCAARRCSTQPDSRSSSCSGAGLPFFNLYKLLVMMRGDAVARDVSSLEPPLPAGDGRDARLRGRAATALQHLSAGLADRRPGSTAGHGVLTGEGLTAAPRNESIRRSSGDGIIGMG